MKKMTTSSVTFISTDLLNKSFSRIRLTQSQASIRPVRSIVKTKLNTACGPLQTLTTSITKTLVEQGQDEQVQSSDQKNATS